MSGLRIRGRSLLFVGGKGGVGKTTTAAALGLKGAEDGRRILLVSTDPAHSLGDLFGQKIGNRELELLPNLWGLELEPEEEVERYLEGVKSAMRTFVRPAMYPEIERQIELTRHSPGATEAALMERMSTLMGEATATYDTVIFDTAPTGHTLRLLTLPEIMAAWMDGLLRSRERSESFGRALDRLARKPAEPEEGSGDRPSAEVTEATEASEEGGSTAPRGDELSWFQETDETPKDEQSRRIREILMDRRRSFTRARRLLLDPETTAFVMVLIPEKLPILETEKALAVLSEHRVPVAGLVVNRVLPLKPLGEFLESRREQESEYLSRIDRIFAKLPRIRVPLLRRDVQGTDSLREIAEYLVISD